MSFDALDRWMRGDGLHSAPSRYGPTSMEYLRGYKDGYTACFTNMKAGFGEICLQPEAAEHVPKN